MAGMAFVSCFIGTCCFLRKHISKDRVRITFSVTVKKCKYVFCFVGVNKVTRMYEISGSSHGVVEVFGVLRARGLQEGLLWFTSCAAGRKPVFAHLKKIYLVCFLCKTSMNFVSLHKVCKEAAIISQQFVSCIY